MPEMIRRCCKTLPFGAIPRARDDGHFAVLYPNIKATKSFEAWQCGAIDLTWKCWACLGNDLGKTYDELVGVHVPLKFSAAFIAQRRSQQERNGCRETPTELYSLDEWLRRRYQDLWRRTTLQPPTPLPDMPLAD